MKHEEKWKKGVVTVLCFFAWVFLFGCQGTWQAGEERDVGKEILSTSAEKWTEGRTEEEVIYVHVCGCVKEPGLYTFCAGERAGDAVKKAGGFTKKANETAINLAELLTDGTQIYVPSREEEFGMEREAGRQEGKINMNTAGAEELVTLSGIGDSRAQAIVAYREENGAFSSIEDIKNVPGIGEGIFEKIKDMITV